MDYSTSVDFSGIDVSNVDPSSMAAIWAMLMGWGIFVGIIGLALYVYMSLATMKIAQKLKTPNAWFAWIPILNIWLLLKMADMPWYWLLLIVGMFIPILNVVCSLALAVILIIAWWKIAMKSGKEGWWGLLIGLNIPIVSWIFIGMLAWGK